MISLWAVQVWYEDKWKTVDLCTYPMDSDRTYDLICRNTKYKARQIRFAVYDLDTILSTHIRNFEVFATRD